MGTAEMRSRGERARRGGVRGDRVWTGGKWVHAKKSQDELDESWMHGGPSCLCSKRLAFLT